MRSHLNFPKRVNGWSHVLGLDWQALCLKADQIISGTSSRPTKAGASNCHMASSMTFPVNGER